MELVFEGGHEIVRYVIDRKTKTLHLANSKTHYELKKIPWKKLFDQGKEYLQDKKTEKLSDEEFAAAIKIEMANVGYMLKHKKLEG